MLWYFNAKVRANGRLEMDSPVKAFSVKVSTIIHATEDPKKVGQAIQNLCLDGAGSVINRVKGHHGNEIVTLVLTTRNAKNAEDLLHHVWKGFSQIDRTEISSSLTSRLNNAGTLFLRVDKQDLLKGRMRLEESDPIKIEISFRTRSQKRDEFAHDIVKRLDEILA
jgi:RNA binding exosome subunit